MNLFSVRSILILFFLICSSISAFAQDNLESTPAPKMHIGINTGLDNFNGLLGVSFEYNIVKPVTAYAGVGIGSWGLKLGAGGRFYLDYPRKFAFNLGISHSTGGKDVKPKIETANGDIKKVQMDLKPVTNLNLSALYFVKVGRKHRFNFELGYSIPLSSGDRYTIKDGQVLSDTGETAMKIIKPGGVIIGLGFSFGL